MAVSRRRLGLLGVVLAVAAAAALAWAELRYDFFPKRWVEVEPGQLYRSGQLSRRLVREVLESHRIRVVVDLDADLAESEPDADAQAEAVEALGIEYHFHPLRGDGTGEVAEYAGAIEAIESARLRGEPTLVHCSAGARRTGGVLAAYQVLVRGVAPDQAYQELDRYGRTPVAETPLVDWLDTHMAELAARLEQRGVIERVPDPLPRFGSR